MIIRVRRKWFSPISTIGTIDVDGVICGFSLEDVARAEGVKIPGKTAIPAGEYKVIIDYSQRFMRPMPHILDVPRFEGIRIHKLNNSSQTEGCIGCGLNKGQDLIYNCDPTFNFIYSKLEEAKARGEEVKIVITNEQI